MKNKIARRISGRIAGILSVLFCYTFIGGCGSRSTVYLESSATEEDSSPQSTEQSVAEDSPQADICVYVCGAVKSPGVYWIAADSRIGDAVNAAGGMTKEASKDYWNLAEYAADGEQIDVPTETEVKEGQIFEEESTTGTSSPIGTDTLAAGTGIASDGKVNINTATREELQQIPGIGATRADQIIEYRESSGGFSKIEDIMNVTGIKEGLFGKMQDYITVHS